MAIPIKQTCDNCGKDTDEAGLEHYTHAPDDNLGIILCWECATNAGFCLMCGGFFGGTEEFFHSGTKGLCCDCASMFDEGVETYPSDSLWDGIDAE